MKIAVAAMGSEVAGHFGHCENFIFFDAEDGKIVAENSVPNPGHRPGFLPNFLADNGAQDVYKRQNWYWVLVVGPVFFVVYYRVFKWYLTKKKLSIDVADEEETDGEQGVSMDEQQKAKAVKIIEGLGGFGNIGVVNNLSLIHIFAEEL